MIEMTVKAFLAGKLEDQDISYHHIYVFWDGDVPLYVGKAMDVEARVWDHFGYMPQTPYRGS